MQWQRYSRGIMLVMLVGLLVRPPVTWGQQPKSGGTLTVGLVADIVHFDSARESMGLTRMTLT